MSDSLAFVARRCVRLRVLRSFSRRCFGETGSASRSASAAPRRLTRSRRSTSTCVPDGKGLPDGQGHVAEGAKVYAAKCASCHGANGQGGSAERLVDRESGKNWDFATNAKLVKTVGNYWPYATTLYDYTYRAMPFMQPGTLTPDETYSLVAYILALNKIVPDDAVMDRTTLPKVVMPSRDRFVHRQPQGRQGRQVTRRVPAGVTLAGEVTLAGTRLAGRGRLTASSKCRQARSPPDDRGAASSRTTKCSRFSLRPRSHQRSAQASTRRRFARSIFDVACMSKAGKSCRALTTSCESRSKSKRARRIARSAS